MFQIFSRTFNNATRLSGWDAPDHWRRQQENYSTRRDRQAAERARLRRIVDETGLK